MNRGKDSCGYYFNGKITKGVGDICKWDLLIENHIFEKPKAARIFIGHTRTSTIGAKIAQNAHPFDIENRMIFAHNGTIYNIEELFIQYSLPLPDIDVDSFALGCLLNRFGIEVLQKYRGYAALLFLRVSEPDSLYLFRGASKTDKLQPDSQEERPLYLMKANEGIYVSSLQESLMAIRDDQAQVPELIPCNRILKITNGAISDDQIEICRQNCNIGLR